MTVYLDERDNDWPAQERLCRDLGVSHQQIKRNSTAFQLRKVIFSYLAKRPFGLFRLLSALDDYWDCKIQLRILTHEAEKYESERNHAMIEQIVRQAGQNLIRESPADWPELIGLFCQKLAHLRYYDEFAGKDYLD